MENKTEREEKKSKSLDTEIVSNAMYYKEIWQELYTETATLMCRSSIQMYPFLIEEEIKADILEKENMKESGKFNSRCLFM